MSAAVTGGPETAPLFPSPRVECPLPAERCESDLRGVWPAAHAARLAGVLHAHGQYVALQHQLRRSRGDQRSKLPADCPVVEHEGSAEHALAVCSAGGGVPRRL